MKTSLQERRLAEVISAVLWAFLLIKIFVYDIDNYVIKTYLHGLSWILRYKFFIFLVFLVLLLLVLKKNKFFKFILFILVYPPFFLFWRIPKLLFGNKNWMGVFTALGISISYFKSLSLNLVISTLVLISGLFIFISNSKVILVISIVILLAYLIIHFIRQFSYGFKRFNIISKLSEFILKSWLQIQDSIKQSEAQKHSKNATSIERQEDERRANRLQWLLILNKTCSFLISKLRYIQKSGATFIYYLLSLLNSIFLTVVVFAILNLGLYKAAPSSFSGPLKGRFIDFFYYSFSLFFGGPGPDFSAANSFARLFSMAEIFFRFLVIGILVFYIFNIIREKHKTDIETSITQLQSQGDELEQVIRAEYYLSIDEAIKEVEKIKGSMLVIINYLISNIDKKME